MPEIANCSYCKGECVIANCREEYLVVCEQCEYRSSEYETKEDAIAAHNKLSLKVRRAEQLIGNRDHPEGYCHRCGGKNLLNWTADNDVWNAVMRKDGSDLFDGIVCPICFVQLAEEKYGRLWRLVLEGDDPEIDKLRVQLYESISKEADLLQRIGQLEHFAELAVPIVEWMYEEYAPEPEDGTVRLPQYIDAKACLAALPKKDGSDE